MALGARREQVMIQKIECHTARQYEAYCYVCTLLGRSSHSEEIDINPALDVKVYRFFTTDKIDPRHIKDAILVGLQEENLLWDDLAIRAICDKNYRYGIDFYVK